MDLEPVAARNKSSIVVLGHGSLEDAALFHKHFPVSHLYVSEDSAVFKALPLRDGSLIDFLGPTALLSAVPTALKSLTRPGTISAKIEQPLPGKGNFRQMGGQFYCGPGDICRFSHVEQTPGSHIDSARVLELTGWI